MVAPQAQAQHVKQNAPIMTRIVCGVMLSSLCCTCARANRATPDLIAVDSMSTHVFNTSRPLSTDCGVEHNRVDTGCPICGSICSSPRALSLPLALLERFSRLSWFRHTRTRRFTNTSMHEACTPRLFNGQHQKGTSTSLMRSQIRNTSISQCGIHPMHGTAQRANPSAWVTPQR